MWIVRIALTRPYTFIVLALMLLIIGPLTIMRTPTDIFPDIDIPVVSVVWTYNGMSPTDMANRINNIYDRVLTTTVNDIAHVESHALPGVSVTKIYFQPDVKIDIALSQVTAVSQTVLRSLPPGTQPPLILMYRASTVPVLQLVLSSKILPEQKINDLALNFVRSRLVTVHGVAVPFPYGGKTRQIEVDLDPKAMQTYGVSAQEVNAAIGAQNLIIPAGTQKIDDKDYFVKLNSSPNKVDEMNDFPIKTTNGRILYVRDVAHVRDGFAPQINIVRVDGERAVLVPIQKAGNASTLSIVSQLKDFLPIIKSSLPAELNISLFADQSIFVTAAIRGVIIEGVIAAALTGLMILLFLGSWRSTLIITLSIPLSILASITMLSLLGHTINIMTLGGLALAVGILVDDATVAIENINWNLEQGKEVEEAIYDGAKQIAVPAFVSTICICIVFVPMFFLGGVAQFLFVPLAEAVIFAMLTSYFLSRTLVATLAKYWLQKHDINTPDYPEKLSWRATAHHLFEEKFNQLRKSYYQLLTWILHHTKEFIIGFLAFVCLSILFLMPWIGTDFFPNVDAGQIKLHIHTPTGTRVEETARIVDTLDKAIRKIIPADAIDSIVDNIGLPVSGINLSYSNSATVGSEDADILISLKANHHSTDDYIKQLRQMLNTDFPSISYGFLPADIVNQIINFGLPSAVNIQIVGLKTEENRLYMNKLIKLLKQVPGLVDVRSRQADNHPTLSVNVDRSRAKDLGFSLSDTASNLLITLSGSLQTNPNFWVNPQTGISYQITTQAPQYRMSSLEALRNIPITSSTNISNDLQILGAVSNIERSWSPGIMSRYDFQPMYDIFASVQDRDLGAVTKDIQKILAQTKNEVPQGSTVTLRGQAETQQQAFTGLYWGLAFAVILVYLLIVINFQSWLDPFIIITALPAALAGITWMLFLTHTTLSVPALTGAIMCMGVATANSILIISFARDHMAEGNSPFTAALEAGKARIRPVIMTALAMIIGMLPMATGFGEGGEQNAPLGRAVIGGLSFATVATLLFVPAVFYLIHGRKRHHKE